MTVCACENTVLIGVHPGHLTSIVRVGALHERRLVRLGLSLGSRVQRSTMGLYMVPGGGRERERERKVHLRRARSQWGTREGARQVPRARRAASACAGSGGRSRARISAPPLNPAAAACAAQAAQAAQAAPRHKTATPIVMKGTT